MPSTTPGRRQHLTRLPDRARKAISGSGPPTAPFALRARPSPVDAGTARSALGLALRIGESMMAVGASAADVTATVLRVAAAYGLTDCQVDITFTSLTISWDPDDVPPLMLMRIVRPRGLDYTRLQGITDLAAAIKAEGLGLEDAHRQLDDVLTAPHPYRRSIHALGWSGVAGCVAFLLGGGWLVALVAAVTTAAIEQTIRALDRRGLPMFFQQVAGAAVATTTAVLLVAWDVQVRTSLVVAAGIVVLLAGLSFVGAAEDAISGFPVTAAARGFEVLTLTTGIVVGIAAVLDLAQRAEVPLRVLDPSPAAAPPAVALLAAAGMAGAWALASHARPAAIGVATAAGALAWTTASGTAAFGAGPAVASAAAAVVAGFCGESLTERLRIPPLLLAVCSIVPLLPGLTIYRGLFAIVVEGDVGRGVNGLVGAAAIGLALAAGVVLGRFFGRPLGARGDRFDRRVRRQATSAP
ncbi:threonine/serine ThrE exporter family protein [Modestobacter sp. VKM Ac-2985]|uniref:threonine/serine ThrE exporter family protein n=1 Tax=Modestobacter sp. VKM Ac-2985 TaxID=3004139 RepID=UPI0022ABA74E|nr:threonine/serine exporter family protein [Modestobacter sp. VKM Ac-2985]MCZ2838967.1 threonine/serine exporter family protein [Modestobacter sp. VKM Ac-2985]